MKTTRITLARIKTELLTLTRLVSLQNYRCQFTIKTVLNTSMT